MNKKEVFNLELSYIKTNKLKELAEIAIDNLPDYFFSVPASSTGKYHPKYALGDGGLVRHTKAAVRIANHILNLEQSKMQFNEIERDYMLVALILHDGIKQGDGATGFSTSEHPLDCAKWLLMNEIFISFDMEDRKAIALLVASHMGEWNKVKGVDILPKPNSEMQKFVHMCDYLASRKDIEIIFGDGTEIPEKTFSNDNATIDTYIMPFGKYKGETLMSLKRKDLGYLLWLRKTELNEPLKQFLEEILK